MKQGNEILGTMSDAKVARLLGVSETLVQRRRTRLGIKAAGRRPSAIKTTAGVMDLLGREKDAVIASMTGLSDSHVAWYRRKLGIPAFCQRAGK